jgi:hypothetical protein
VTRTLSYNTRMGTLSLFSIFLFFFSYLFRMEHLFSTRKNCIISGGSILRARLFLDCRAFWLKWAHTFSSIILFSHFFSLCR